jgi:hypothetical protein
MAGGSLNLYVSGNKQLKAGKQQYKDKGYFKIFNRQKFHGGHGAKKSARDHRDDPPDKMKRQHNASESKTDQSGGGVA